MSKESAQLPLDQEAAKPHESLEESSGKRYFSFENAF